jgi:hypothetical protein
MRFLCRMRSVAGLLLLATLLVPAGGRTALADDPTFVGWAALLPSLTDAYNPNSDNDCVAGRPHCLAATIREMERRFEPLGQSCDHGAIFSLAYLRTTQTYGWARDQAGFFNDTPWVNHEDAVFAKYYFNAYDGWATGHRDQVPQAWLKSFDAAAAHQVTGSGSLLLGMNAHINRDLPYTLAHVGLRKPDGSPRKLDHDKVNQFLDRVIDPLQVELAQRYDPIFTIVDAEPSPADEVGALQGIRGLRENAWRNAEDLVSTRNNPLLHALVKQQIETEAAAFALNIVAVSTIPGYGAYRDAYCTAAH